jgi:hypothetical protein
MREGYKHGWTQPAPAIFKEKIFAISVDEWKSAFAPTVQVYTATRFVIVGDGTLVRLAFGNLGAPIDEQAERDTPVFTVAIP